MSRPILSIIIPTRNRQKYCYKSVKQILELKLTNIQIVVQDNSDTVDLKNQLDLLNEKCVKYHYHKGILSFVDNFSEAVSIADGEYLCCIGDDDGILPNILSMVILMKKEGYDALVPGLNSVYAWPSEKPFIKNAENGYMCSAYISNILKKVNPMDGLKQLMENAGQDYQSCDLPRLYHGIVKKEAVDKVKSKTDHYFGGLTPDIYMAVALAFICKTVYRANFPVTISGMCPRSGSSDSATGKHTGNLKDAPHFKGHEFYSWDKKAPPIYSVESIWAETVLQALHDFKAEGLYNIFNVDLLDSICLYKYPQFHDEILDHAKLYNINKLKLYYLARKVTLGNLFKRILRRITRKKGDVNKYYNVLDIEDAAKIVIRELKEKGICRF